MTQEEKAKAYDEALEKAKIEINTKGIGETVNLCYQLFPELAENKDEKIKKIITDSVFYQYGVGAEYKDVLDYLDKLEKQKKEEECTDFTIYHPLKNGDGKYECIPYSFYGSLTSFSENKDLIDFLRTCFYTEEECNEWIKQQNEQKPVPSREMILGIMEDSLQQEQSDKED